MSHGEIQIDEDMRFQRVQWAIERVAWAGIGVIVTAALLGLTGGHGLIDGLAQPATDGAGVRLARFVRWRAPSELIVRAADDGSGVPSVWIGSDYLEDFEIVAVFPPSDGAELDGDGVRFVFGARPGAALDVVFRVEAKRVGRVGGRVGADPATAHEVDQFSYP